MCVAQKVVDRRMFVAVLLISSPSVRIPFKRHYDELGPDSKCTNTDTVMRKDYICIFIEY